MHKDFVCKNCEDIPNSEGSAKEAHEVSPSKLNTEKVYTNLNQQLKKQDLASAGSQPGLILLSFSLIFSILFLIFFF